MSLRREVQAIIVRDGKVLIVQKNGAWRLPKGGVELGETLIQTLHRELLEEINLEFNDAQVIHEYSYEHANTKHQVTVFEVKTDKQDIFVDGKELSGAQWLDPQKAIHTLQFGEEKNCIAVHLRRGV
jgi:8-oxo-dGTP pyrophosphatase MutT (NUDIX family)